MKDSSLVIAAPNRTIGALKFHFHNGGLLRLLSFERNKPETLCFDNTGYKTHTF